MSDAARLSLAEFERLARLARLRLSTEEAEGLRADLDRLLGYMQELGELSLEADVAAAAEAADADEAPAPEEGAGLGWRADEARPSLPRELALAAAPEAAEGAFVVPQVMEGD